MFTPADIDLNLEILGDQDEAVQWRQQNSQPVQVEESDPENDQQEVGVFIFFIIALD